MTVSYYGRGDHPGGFIGFRVNRTPIGDFKQTYFATSHIAEQLDSDVRFKYLRLKAEHYDASWGAEVLFLQYQRFVSENHPTTDPVRGVGVHGITASFTVDRRDKWQACFLVAISSNNDRPRGSREFTFRTHEFSKVWGLAVEFWAQEHGIIAEDKARVLATPPSPEQFKLLRRKLNDESGADIPIEAISPVFAEQRALLSSQRSNTGKAKNAAKVTTEESSRGDIDQLNSEMTLWFEDQRKTNA
jgi:hypothetical protein